jgi:hypothetical protein
MQLLAKDYKEKVEEALLARDKGKLYVIYIYIFLYLYSYLYFYIYI